MNEDGERFAALSVHFTPRPAGYAKRKVQWARALAIVASVREELELEVIMLGDYNSTGFWGQPEGEREFVDGMVDEAGYELLTKDIACTQYWRPSDVPDFVPSILDHIVVTGGSWSQGEPQEMCRRLACEKTEPADMDPDWYAVSDHCPVLVEGRL